MILFKIMLHGFYKSNNKTTIRVMFLEQQIIMISDGSCDTEDWSNDAENSAFRHRNQLQFKTY